MSGARNVVVAALLAAVLTLTPSAAVAVTTAGWATWQPLSGSAGAFTTTMQLPAGGFPAATVTTDSRGGQVGVQTGASVWLSEATPPGEKYGSSRDQQYLNLRPRADNATSPSTTTYTFERPTPVGGWAFVLGDIDADRAVVIARGEDGQLLTGAELGWQGGFNYCAVSPSPTCTGDAADVATWDPVTGEVIGNEAGADTSGAAGWFEPTVPITSLTIFFFQRSGFPVYQTWFASLARDITGVVTHDVDGPIEGATLTLFGPDGTQLATTTSAADGTYSFPEFAASDGYTVEMRVPADASGPGYIAVGPTLLPADLSTTDATDVDFVVRDIVPVPVSGGVTDVDGNPVPGATITLTPSGGGTPVSIASDSTGAYLFDMVESGDYELSIDAPPGYTVIESPGPVTVPDGSEEPITDQNFVVQAPAEVSGTVTGGGQGVPGAVVTITGPGGTVTTPTAADGSYSFADLPPGEYTVTLEVPFGYTPEGPTSQQVVVTTEDVTDVDFAVARPGAIGGMVTEDDGTAIPGVTVVVSGPGGDVTVTTDDAGAYFVDQLPAGDYSIALTVPDGYSTDVTERTTSITSAGESQLDQDFELTAEMPLHPVQVGGTVTETEGPPVTGAVVTLRDPDGAIVATVTTADDGTWSVELTPGVGYTAEVTPPDGYVVEGEPVLTFDVVDVAVVGLDFVLQIVATPTPTPTPTPAPTPPPTSPPSDPVPGSPAPGTGVDSLPATGADVNALTLGAALLMAAGWALAATSRRRIGSRRDT